MGIRTLKPGLPKKTTHGGENARTYAAYFTKQHGFEHSSEHVVVTIASLASRNNDIQRLREQCAHAIECIVIGGDGSGCSPSAKA